MKLIAHPDHPAGRVARVAAAVDRPDASRLRLRYVVDGAIEDLVLPQPASHERRNNLWETTCFEAFLKPEGSQCYVEINASPSGAWNAFDFAAYRAGMVQAAFAAPPEISVRTGKGWLEVEVSLCLDLRSAAYRLGLAAVVEERGGQKSYWALAHPAGAPDFHHPACFAAELPPPGGS